MPDYGDDKGFGSGSLGGREDGGDTKDFGKSVGPTPDKPGSGLSPALATAMFGNQLGPKIAGLNITNDAASNLAARMNIGQIKMTTSSIDNKLMSSLAYGPVASVLDIIGRYAAKDVFNNLVQGANPVYNSKGYITGAQTDERGLVAGYDSSKTELDNGGNNAGTFTSSSSIGTESSTSVTSASSSIPVSDYEKRRGNPDSSGSGRRSLLGKVYNG